MGTMFYSEEDVRAMTADQAQAVLFIAANNLIHNLDMDPANHVRPGSPHWTWSDDAADDVSGATDHWAGLLEIYMTYMGDWDVIAKNFAEYLMTAPVVGADGEFRYTIMPDVAWGQD